MFIVCFYVLVVSSQSVPVSDHEKTFASPTVWKMRTYRQAGAMVGRGKAHYCWRKYPERLAIYKKARLVNFFTGNHA